MAPFVVQITEGNFTPRDLLRAENSLNTEVSRLSAAGINGGIAYERLLAVADRLHVSAEKVASRPDLKSLAAVIRPAAHAMATDRPRTRHEAFSALQDIANAARIARGEAIVEPPSSERQALIRQHVIDKYRVTLGKVGAESAVLAKGMSFASACAELHDLCTLVQRGYPALDYQSLSWLHTHHGQSAGQPIRFSQIGNFVQSVERRSFDEQRAKIAETSQDMRIPRREEALFIHALNYFLTAYPLSDGRIVRTATHGGNDGLVLTDQGIALVSGERVNMFSRAFGIKTAA